TRAPRAGRSHGRRISIAAVRAAGARVLPWRGVAAVARGARVAIVSLRRAAAHHDPDQPLLREGALGARARRPQLSRGAPRAGRAPPGGAGAGGGRTVPVLVTPER